MAPERIDIPMGTMNVADYDESLSPSALRAVVNAVPMGDPDSLYYTPVGTPDVVASGLTGIVALGRQYRTRRGRLSDLEGDPNQSLDRYVAVTDEHVFILDPGQETASGWKRKAVFKFERRESRRKAQFAQVGDALVIATSTGPGHGTPEALLILEDDACVPFQLPDPPALVVTIEPRSGLAAVPGVYAFRTAWAFRDGTHGPASPPHLVHVGVGDTEEHRYDLIFHVDPEATGAMLPYWHDHVAGIAVLAATPAPFSHQATGASASIDAMLARPFHVVTTISVAEPDDE